jgi:hypothetical protein
MSERAEMGEMVVCAENIPSKLKITNCWARAMIEWLGYG